MKKLILLFILLIAFSCHSQRRKAVNFQTLEYHPASVVPDANNIVINASNKANYAFVEGVVSDSVALLNKAEFQRVIDSANTLGLGLKVDDLDMYMDVTTPYETHYRDLGVQFHDNFTLEIGSNCVLRVQPNGRDGYSFFAVNEVDNVTIKGSGKLWGDRYTHDYEDDSGRAAHAWGFMIEVKAAHNVVIDGLEIREGTADAVKVAGREHRYDDGTLKPTGKETYNLVVKNCLLDDNRRNNISITDGSYVYIHDNEILNAGSGTADTDTINSNGRSPRCGIDIESYKEDDPANPNENQHFEHTDYIYIYNNHFEGNFAADLLIYNGELAFVYGNTFNSSTGISTSYGFNNKVYNNTFDNTETVTESGRGIRIEGQKWVYGGGERHVDWEIYGNTFNNYQFGMIITGERHNVYDNTITECQYGIRLGYNTDSSFSHNDVTSAVSSSNAYSNSGVDTNLSNVTITGGDFTTTGSSINFTNVNVAEVGSVVIDSTNTTGSLRFNTANNITLQNSTYGSITIINCTVTESNNNP